MIFSKRRERGRRGWVDPVLCGQYPGHEGDHHHQGQQQQQSLQRGAQLTYQHQGQFGG